MILKCFLLLFLFCFIDAQFSYYRQQSQCETPRLAHGRVRMMRRGSMIRFSCSNRYTLVGNKYATCRGSSWDVPAPNCVRSGCSPFPSVQNAVTLPSHNDSWIVFFCMPGYQLIGSPVVYCDGTYWNSTAPACVEGKSKHQTECDFEDEKICGWELDELHDFDWRRWNQKTPSSFLQTGPAYDHTYGKNGTGHYMYIESTGRIENDTARLISPVYDNSLAKDGCFVFFYHMFGRSMGGLRVYQKPEKMSLYAVLNGPTRERYLLFEKWGDQGNEWYGSVSMLSDFSDAFQIVVEGIRGVSFMSDIAIDDVSIQQGANCTKAMSVTTRPPSLLESCVGRCDVYGFNRDYAQRGCGCDISCVVDENCCQDFLDVCAFNFSSNDDETTLVSGSSDGLPQTQKLVATTTETLPPTTTTRTTTVTTRSTTTTTRPTTVTTRRTTTTTRPTTVTTRRTTTTTRPTTSTMPPTTSTTSTTRRSTTTTRRPTTTTRRPTTTRPTTKRSTTTRPTKPTTMSATKAVRPTVKNVSTTLRFTVAPISSTTFFFARTTKLKVQTTPKSKGVSGTTALVTGLVVSVLCLGAMWVGFHLLRSARGRTALARLRGRTTRDPEVRYLKTDVDEDE